MTNKTLNASQQGGEHTNNFGGVLVVDHILLRADDLNLDIRTDNTSLRFGQVASSDDLSEVGSFELWILIWIEYPKTVPW